MPIISYPKAAHDKAVDYARQLADIEADSSISEHLQQHRDNWITAEIGGFFRGLGCCLPSESVGLVVMVHDDALESFRNKRAEAEDERCQT